MANRINNRRYNKLLSYRNNYYVYGSQMQNDPYRLNGIYSTPAIVSGMGGAQNPTQGFEPTITPPSATGRGLFGNLGATIVNGFKSGALNGLAGGLGNIAGGVIGGGMSSGVGSAMTSLSGLASAIPGPWGAVASAGLGVLGGLTNRMFGSKLNKENIADVEGNINRLNSLQADANSFDTLADIWGNTSMGSNFTNSYIGKDGWFSNKAKKKAKQLRDQMELANAYAKNALQNNANNISETTMNNLEANYAALGGFLNQYADGGSIYIKPENRGKFNATKKRTGKTIEELTHSKNPLTRKRAIFAQNAAKWHHAFGGELNTNGADFSTGLTFIDNGGLHEDNPYEGVPMGVDPEGNPNLVEEGEVIYNDYVFSNRLTVPKTIRSKYKLKGDKDLTFADAVKQISKGATERPNDSISQETLHEIMSDLAQTQEGVREEASEGNKFAKGGILGNLYGGSGPAWQVLNRNNKTKGLNFGDPNFNPYTKDGDIDWEIMYGENSPYMKRRQYVLDNWESEGVKNWLSKYVEGVNAYNNNRTGYKPMSVNDITKDVFEHRTFDRSWGGMHSGIDYAGDPSINRADRHFLRSKDASGKYTITPMEVIPWKGFAQSGKYKGLKYEEAFPNYKEAGSEERPLDKGTNTIYTDHYYDVIPEEKAPEEPEKLPPLNLGRSNENLRYIPAIGLGLASITDALGLTNKPDYSEAAQIEATTRGGSYRPVSWSPIGNKLSYRPFDRDYYTNKLSAEAGALRRSLANQSGGNSGRAIAGLLAADYNAQDKLGELFRKSEEYNLEQRQKIEDFNRATNQANSQGMLQADMANQQAYANARESNLRGILAAAEMRQKARLSAEAAKSANLSGLLQAIGDIGYENKSLNMIRALMEAGLVPVSDSIRDLYATSSAKKRLTSNGKTNKKGGK